MSSECISPTLVTETVLCCNLCGAPGDFLHANLPDDIGNASGEWNLKRCTNPGCGLVWLDPRPAPQDIGKAYLSYYTHNDSREPSPNLIRRGYEWLSNGYLALKYGYGRNKTSWFQLVTSNLLYLIPDQRARLDFSAMYLPFVSSGRLLEIGCGSGRMLQQFQRLGWQCEGIDLDPEAVRNANRKGLEVHEGELCAQRYPDNYFDAVVMSHVIEHVYDPKGLLAECRRVLKPSGRLVLVTPNLDSLGHRLYREHWRGLECPRHLHLFTASLLAKVAESVGFRCSSFGTTIGGAHWILRSSRQIKARATGSNTAPLGNAVIPRLLQYAEWLLLKFNVDAGEEIVLILQK